MTLTLNGCVITVSAVQSFIDKLITGGYDHRDLRLRVGRRAMHGIQHYLLTTADPNTARVYVESGMPYSGMFGGSFFCLDESIPDDEIRVQLVKGYADVGSIIGISISGIDEKLDGLDA